MQAEGNISRYLKITKDVPQGSVLGPLLFILYINNIDSNVSKGNVPFYADYTVLFCSASTADQALSQLQLNFNTLQQNLYDLKLVLNAEKKQKSCFFSNFKSKSNLPSILTSQGTKIECVSKYKYLGILIDESLSKCTCIGYYIPGVLKVCIQGSKSEFSSVSKVRTGIIGYYKTCFSYCFLINIQ